MLQLIVSNMKHADHNVVTASLEVLHQLLKHASRPLRVALISRGIVGSLLAHTSRHTGVYFYIYVNWFISFNVRN